MDFHAEISRQVPPLQNDDLWQSDLALRQMLAQAGVDGTAYGLPEYARHMGSASMRWHANQADRHPPELTHYDSVGQRQDAVQFHPSWYQILRSGLAQGLHTMSTQPQAELARAAGFYLHGQIEAGSLCPMTMTRAGAGLLRQEPGFAWLESKLDSRVLDERDVPLEEKQSVLIGMGLTEMQGGSDLRQVSTRAVQDSQTSWSLYGHKWFFSVPQSDAHLVLAQEDQGLSCFWVPRWWQGSRNAVQIRRLKDKAGNRANASAEVEFHAAQGLRVGEPGRGLALLIRMASTTRLDCVLGSAALMRQALAQACYFSAHRHAFGQLLNAQPLMQSVLADLALESEAAIRTGLALTASAAQTDSKRDQALIRVLAPAAKYWVCKRAISVCAEAMEVWGGNGYVETSVLPRLLREAPVNSIWEGSGNIMCLDVLRAWSQPAIKQTVQDFFEQHIQQHPALQAYWRKAWMSQPELPPAAAARQFTTQLILLYQSILLLESAPDDVAYAFIQTRLQGASLATWGESVLPAAQAIIARAWCDTL